MTAFIVMYLIGFAMLIAYTTAMICKFGIPDSYSETFYKLNEIKPGLGALFPILLVSTTALIMPMWLELSDIILPNLTFLAFFGGTGICFVAAAPYFKEMAVDTGHPLKDLIYRSFHGQGLVHTIGALTSMIGVFTWTLCSPYWMVLPILAAVITIIALCTKTLKRAIVFWGEVIIFLTIYIVLLIGGCSLIFA